MEINRVCFLVIETNFGDIVKGIGIRKDSRKQQSCFRIQLNLDSFNQSHNMIMEYA